MQSFVILLGLALYNGVVGSNHTRELGDGDGEGRFEGYSEGVRGMANTSFACQLLKTFSGFRSFPYYVLDLFVCIHVFDFQMAGHVKTWSQSRNDKSSKTA